jgi:hypothetical protein
MRAFSIILFKPGSNVSKRPAPVGARRRDAEDAESITNDLDRICRIETAPVLPLGCCFHVNPVNPVKGLAVKILYSRLCVKNTYFQPITVAMRPVGPRSPRYEKKSAFPHTVHFPANSIFESQIPADLSWSLVIAQKSKYSGRT